MKRLFLALLIFIAISCSKDNSDDVQPTVSETKGFIEGYIENNSEKVKLWETNNGSPVSAQIPYSRKSEVLLGYTFVPYKNIEITHLGGKIARKGSYDIYLILMDDIAIFNELDTLIVNQINTTDTTTFQYKEVNKTVLLQKDKRYMIRYFMNTIDASYDLVINDNDFPVDDDELFPHPLRTMDLRVDDIYIGNLGTLMDGTTIIGSAEFTSGAHYMRGLPDFKYKLIE